MRAVTDALANAVTPSNRRSDAISILPNGDATALELATEPYPGFPTDMQAQMCALLSTTKGTSSLRKIFFHSATCTWRS